MADHQLGPWSQAVHLHADVERGDTAVAMTNTILVSHSVGLTVTADSTTILNGVLWYNNATNYGGGGTISVTNGYTGKPAFDTAGYHLTAASAAIDTGVNSGIDFPTYSFHPHSGELVIYYASHTSPTLALDDDIGYFGSGTSLSGVGCGASSDLTIVGSNPFSQDGITLRYVA